MGYIYIGNNYKGMGILKVNNIVDEKRFYINLWKKKYNIDICNIKNKHHANKHDENKHDKTNIINYMLNK
tara:strand:- start:242 stop:451 length:210 start_codon:yes stop_codon:yes gene_type:complete